MKKMTKETQMKKNGGFYDPGYAYYTGMGKKSSNAGSWLAQYYANNSKAPTSYGNRTYYPQW